ncbi:MarR family winged helix-turn-helix transcriptional regulator [Streptacidiphilus monticola]|uniref:MarR family winged helix-turn-helix transcriptional regulator n=1 Tax=Streptacidiphilus monticola TaxID=2161674 RepID=A0ABW1G4K2_9ACTN
MSGTTKTGTAPSKAALMEVFAAIGAAYYQDFASVAARHGLTSVQAKVLGAIVREPVPMRGLADMLVCDASNVTGIIDRLESRGLVRRETSPQDRRVKVVVATDEGREALLAVREDMEAAQRALDLLSPEERTSLYGMLTRVLPVLQQRG